MRDVVEDSTVQVGLPVALTLRCRFRGRWDKLGSWEEGRVFERKSWGHRVNELDLTGRLRFLVVIAGLGLILVASPAGSPAWGQDSDRGPSASASGGTGARPGAGADDEASGDQSGSNKGEGESFLRWMFRASGWIGLIIVFMSIYLVALVVWMFLHYRMPVVAPGELVSDVQNLLDQSKYNEAYHQLAEDDSFFARVLAAGVRKLPAGLDQGRRAMELANEDATMQMEHRTTYLATVGTLGPMIGLVGTVYGMMLSFRVIAQAGSTPQASDLASGISTALVATLLGIAVSIPAIYFHALFRNRIARLSLEVGMMVEPLLERFVPGVRMTGPAPGQGSGVRPAPPPPPPHAHPFAVSAALAAGVGATDRGGRPALPPAKPPSAADLE
jgi:biopolymer transport protein ExbB